MQVNPAGLLTWIPEFQPNSATGAHETRGYFFNLVALFWLLHPNRCAVPQDFERNPGKN